MIATINTLNTVYNVKETRPFWKIGGIAVLLTIGAAMFAISSMALILAGENLSQRIAEAVGLNWLASHGWTMLQWPVAFLLMLLATSLIYYWGPNIKHKWHWLLPGSVLAVFLWVVISLGFKLYVENLMYYNLVYGSITGVIVLMIWLYISGMVLLIGGELNAVLEATKLNKDEPRV
jgi:membrane protein